MGKLMTSQRIKKGLNGTGKCAYNFYGFHLKSYRFESMFFRVEKLLPSKSTICNLNFIKIETFIFLSDLEIETLRFLVTLLDKLERLSLYQQAQNPQRNF